jgi:hypothetical protein
MVTVPINPQGLKNLPVQDPRPSPPAEISPGQRLQAGRGKYREGEGHGPHPLDIFPSPSPVMQVWNDFLRLGEGRVREITNAITGEQGFS